MPNPTKNQRNEMKTKTYPLRRSFLLATLASTFLLPAVQAAKLVEEEEEEGYHAVCQEVLDKINATPDFFPVWIKKAILIFSIIPPSSGRKYRKSPLMSFIR